MNRKKVCMVVDNYFTNDSRVEREAVSLKNDGYEVTVFAKLGAGLPHLERKSGILVKRVNIKTFSPLRLKPWKFLEVYRVLRDLINEKADIYHAHDLDTLAVTYFAAQFNKSKLIYDFHEFWPNKTFFFNSIFSHILHILVKKPEYYLTEKILVKKIDTLITVNDSLARRFQNKYKVSAPLVLYNCTPLFWTERSNILRKTIGAKRVHKIILFLGRLSRYRGLENLLKSIKLLDKEFKLVFLGYGPLKTDLNHMVIKENLVGRVKFLDAVKPNKVVEWASSADVGVVPIQNVSWSYYHSTPNKVFEYMAAGLPIAASNFPEMRRIVEENEIGITFNPDSPEDIARSITEIFSDESRYEQMKENSLKAAREKYNWENEEKKLTGLYRKLIS